MYVAVTRAAKQLYLSWAQTRMLHAQTLYCVLRSSTKSRGHCCTRSMLIGRAPAWEAAACGAQPGRKPAWQRQRAARRAADRHERPARQVRPGRDRVGGGSGGEARVQIELRGAGMEVAGAGYAKLLRQVPPRQSRWAFSQPVAEVGLGSVGVAPVQLGPAYAEARQPNAQVKVAAAAFAQHHQRRLATHRHLVGARRPARQRNIIDDGENAGIAQDRVAGQPDAGSRCRRTSRWLPTTSGTACSHSESCRISTPSATWVRT